MLGEAFGIAGRLLAEFLDCGGSRERVTLQPFELNAFLEIHWLDEAIRQPHYLLHTFLHFTGRPLCCNEAVTPGSQYAKPRMAAGVPQTALQPPGRPARHARHRSHLILDSYRSSAIGSGKCGEGRPCGRGWTGWRREAQNATFRTEPRAMWSDRGARSKALD